MSKILCILFSLSLVQLHGQACETYNRKLFHELPIEFPDTINCIDHSGQKQGWWLIYKMGSNRKNEDVVKSYDFGTFNNNEKNGTWRHINYATQSPLFETDSIFYGKDSLTIHTKYVEYGIVNNVTTQINADFTRIRYTHYPYLPLPEVIFDCDLTRPEAKQCKKLYRKVVIKEFPFDHCGIEADRLWFDQREIRLINEKFDKQSDGAE